jgi:hypothetical protein
MNLLERLRSFGAYIMDDQGNHSEFSPNPHTTAAADAIEMLREERDHWMNKALQLDNETTQPPDTINPTT